MDLNLHFNKQKRNRRGFTLVELVVTMAMLAILLALAGFSLSAYVRYAKFKKQNEYAQTLFVAAQNQLTQYSVNGKLDDLSDLLESTGDNGTEKVKPLNGIYTTFTTDDGAKVSPATLWPESANKGEDAQVQALYRGKVYAIIGTASDYQRYLAGELDDTKTTKAEDRALRALYDLFSEYLYDRSILNATICVEFEPNEGLVYSVFYDEYLGEDEAFVYNDAQGKVDIKDRTEVTRKKNYVGYYGVYSLYKSTSNKAEKPVIANLTLNNAETLNLSFNLSKVEEAWNQLTYTLTVQDADEGNLALLTITFDGKDLTAPAGEKRTILGTVKRGDTSLGQYPFLYWVELNGTTHVVHFVLDAVDLSATSELLAKEFGAITKSGTDFTLNGQSFYKTYSFHRFGVDAENIRCTLQGRGDDYKPTASKDSNTESTYFKTSKLAVDSTDSTKYTAEYTIANARHLYNIRFVEDFTDTERTANAALGAKWEIAGLKGNKAQQSDYQLVSDINWNAFAVNSWVYHTDLTKMVAASTVQGVTPTEALFPTIRQLRTSATLNGKRTETKNWVVSGLHISETYNLGNVFTDPTNDRVQTEVELYTAEGESKKYTLISYPTGLFAYNYGTIQNLTLDRIQVTGQDSVGGFCGVNGGTLTNLEVANTDLNATGTNAIPSKITGISNVGGITGAQHALDDATYTALAAAARATPTAPDVTTVPGFTGTMEQEQGEAGVVENAYNVTIGKEQSIKGQDNKTEKVTCTYYNLKNRAEVSGLLYVGGILGQMNATTTTQNGITMHTKLRVENCTNYGAVAGTEWQGVSGEPTRVNLRKLGTGATGVTGTTDEQITLTNQTVRYVGGIVGWSHNTVALQDANYQKTDTDGQLTNTKDTALAQYIILNNCISSPQYSTASIESILKKSADGQPSAYLVSKLSGVYVGGLVGYNDFGTVQNSSTKKESAAQEGYVFGYQYVGGIVGFNRGPASGITGSTGENQDGINAANTIGHTYVGGVTGCNSSQKDTDKATGIVIPQKETEPEVVLSKWTNKGIVMATGNYVGGITGYNTGWIKSCNSAVSSTSVSQQVSNASSQYGDYAGGIVGYNNGYVNNREQYDDESEQSLHRLTAICYITGRDYVGGIVGYNDVDALVEDYEVAGGEIIATGSFVGGYAGFNASAALLMSTTKGADGQPQRAPRNIISSPNTVTGTYAVGGTIGGNFIATNIELITSFKTDNFLGRLTATAFAGGFIGCNRIVTLEGEYLAAEGDTAEQKTAKNDALKKEIQITADALRLQLRYIQENPQAEAAGEMEGEPALRAAVSLLEGMEYDSLDDSVKTELKDSLGAEKLHTWHVAETRFTIQGESSDKPTQARFEGLQASIYVGGVMGYVYPGTKMTIKDVINYTPVTATMAIHNETEQQGAQGQELTEGPLKAAEFTYSYAGGVIGKVENGTSIISCSNNDAGEVSSQGTYSGGLCEINEGTIEACNAGSYGQNNWNYVGGIAGLNKAGATITGCKLANNVTITGSSFVGGIAAENYGTISGSVLGSTAGAARVTSATAGDSAPKNVGGLVGANYSTGSITLTGDSNMIVTSTGENIGGIVGYNKGTVTVGTTQEGKAENTGSVQGSVTGGKNVGGVIGMADAADKNITGLTNKAVVTANGLTSEDGTVTANAGGIVGENAQSATIENCNNNGIVTAVNGGNAGGIVANNNGTIRDCTDTAEVAANHGTSGGITAVNRGTIANCTVAKSTESGTSLLQMLGNLFAARSNELLTFTGYLNAGGVCGENYGIITGVHVSDIAVVNMASSTANQGSLGGIAGVNNAGGTITLGATPYTGTVAIKTYISGNNLGGVVGTNAGTINAKNGTEDTTAAITGLTVSFAASSATNANMGGVAGVNNAGGTITGMAVDATITGQLGGETLGYGGVAGVNSGAITGSSFDGTLEAAGTADNVANLGGITGRNEATTGVIENCKVGINKTTTITNGTDISAFGYVGGMVGWNFGTLKDSNNTENVPSVTITNYMGHVGGLIGWQAEGATATGSAADKILSTGKQWAVNARYYSNDCGTGGIIGYSNSGVDMAYVENNATVDVDHGSSANNIAVGGMIGRLENRLNSAFKMSYCTNTGTVGGKKAVMTGGFIGRIKYKGITIEYGKNTGAINGSSTTGGLLGGMYMLDNEEKINIYSSINFGTVTGGSGKAGGILGSAEASMGSNIAATISNCINVGTVSGGVSGGGGVGGIVGNGSNYLLYLYRCRNYGYLAKDDYAGIVPNSYNSMVDCFSISRSERLATSGGSASNSYFLSSTGLPAEEDEGLYVSSILVGSGNADCTTDLESETLVSVSDTSANKKVLVNFDTWTRNSSEYPKLTHFGIQWSGGGSNNSTWRQYKFTVQAKMAGTTWYLEADEKWTTKQTDAYIFTAYGSSLATTSSYWSINLGGADGIENIQININSIYDASYDETTNLFTATSKASNYIVLTKVAASTDANAGNAFTSTVKTRLGGKEAKYIEAKQKYEAAIADNKAIAELEATYLYEKDWTLSVTNAASALNNLNSAFQTFNGIPAGSSAKRVNYNANAPSNATSTTVMTLTPPNTTLAEAYRRQLTALDICWAGNSDTLSTSAVSRQYAYTIKAYFTDGTISEMDKTAIGGTYTEGKAYFEPHSELFTGGNAGKTVDHIEITMKSQNNSGLKYALTATNASQGDDGKWTATTFNSGNNYICFWSIRINGSEPEGLAGLKAAWKEKYGDRTFEQIEANFKETEAAYLNAENEGLDTAAVKQASALKKRIVSTDPGDSQISQIGYYAGSVLMSDETYTIKHITGSAQLENYLTGITQDPRYGYSPAVGSGEDRWNFVYKEIDEKLQKYYKNAVDKVDAPANVTVANAANVITINWTPGSSYYSQQLVYKVTKTESDGSITLVANNFATPIKLDYGVKSYMFTMDADWQNCTITAYVRSNSGAYNEATYEEKYYPGGSAENPEDGCSAWVASTPLVLLPPQVTPKVHLELDTFATTGTSAESKRYVAVLENPEDYADETVIKVGLSDSVAGTKSDVATITVDKNNAVNHSGAIGKYTDSNVANYYFASWAEGDGTHSKSATTMVQFAYYSPAKVANTKMLGTSFNGFYGNLTANLSYQLVETSKQTTMDAYVVSELVIPDYTVSADTTDGASFAVDVAVQNGLSHVTSVSTATSNLGSLPADLTAYSSIIARVYPWQTQSYAVWYGHTVKTGLSKEELISYLTAANAASPDAAADAGTDADAATEEKPQPLLDPERGNQAVFTKTRDQTEEGETKIAIADGYVLRLTSDANGETRYDVIYSALLNGETYQKQVDTKTYAVDHTKNEMTSDNVKTPIRETPTIANTCVANSDGYRFNWSMTTKVPSNYSFSLVLYGVNNGKRVQLATATANEANRDTTVTDKNSYSYTFTDSTNSWNYSEMVLSVECNGEVDPQTGKTTTFPSSAVQSFGLKLRLSTIAKPTVSLAKEADGTVDRNKMHYQVEWQGVPTLAEQNELAGYVVTVKSTATETPTATHYYWVLCKNGTEADKPALPAGSSWSQLISQTPTPEATVPQNTAYTHDAVLDLSEFQRGEKIEISVQPIALASSASYRNGAEGVARDYTLPLRLLVPSIGVDESTNTTTNMSSSKPYAQDSFVTTEELENEGIDLTFTCAEPVNTDAQGGYQLAAAVYAAQGDAGDQAQYAEGDAPETPTEGDTKTYWNTGALATLVSKANPQQLDGNFVAGAGTLKPSAAYAGQWLKLPLRSISQSNISSWWSDEDEGEDNEAKSIDYAWVQLPRVQLTTPELSQATSVEKYESEGGAWVEPETTGTVWSITQTSLQFTLPDYTTGYRIQMIHDKQADGATPATLDATTDYLDWLYLKQVAHLDEETGKTTDTYKVYFASTDPNVQEKIARPEGSDEEPYVVDGISATYIGELTQDAIFRLPGTFAVAADASSTIYSIRYLKCTETGIQLVLPNVQKVGEVSNEESMWLTGKVSVQAIAADAPEQARYADSQIANWYRTAGVSPVAETEILSDYADAPELGDITLEKETDPNDETKITALKADIGYHGAWLAAELQLAGLPVYDEAGQQTGTSDKTVLLSLPGTGDYGSDITSVLRLLATQYPGIEQATVSARFTALNSVGSGNASKWTETKQLYAPAPETATQETYAMLPATPETATPETAAEP